MFIELHGEEMKYLVNTNNICFIADQGEHSLVVFGGDKWISVDESYDEVVRMIRESGGCE